MKLEVIDDETGFADLRGDWGDLLDTSGSRTESLTFDWIDTWWHTRVEAGRLHIVVLQGAEGDLLGVLPMYSLTQGRAVRVRAGRLLGDRGAGSTRLAPFARPDVEAEALQRFGTYLRSGAHGWDLIDADYVEVGSPFHDLLSRIPGASLSGPSGLCPSIVLPKDFDAYLRSLPRERARKTRRFLAKADESGAHFEHLHGVNGTDRDVEDLLRLHELHMKTVRGPRFQVPSEYRSFVRAIAPLLAAKGKLHLFFLVVDGRRTAAIWALRDGDAMVAHLGAFIPVEGLPNAFRALIGRAIESAIGQGCSTFDMHLGEHAYKFEWGVTSVTEYGRVRIYASTFRGRARRARDLWVTKRQEES